MSDRQNENALRIAAYLENKLSPMEREAFKRALSEDDGLRLQYIDALMNRAGTGASAEPAGTADEKGHPWETGGAGTQHEGGEVADEWMGIVRGAEGARDEGKPDTGQEAPGAAAGLGEQEGIVQGASIGDSEGERNAGSANEDRETKNGGEGLGPQVGWGAPRNWESSDHMVVTDTAGERHDEGSADREGEGRRELSGHWEREGRHGDWETRGEQGAREAWEAGWRGGKKGGRSGFLGSRWMVGLAVLLLLIASVVVIMMIKRQGFWDRALAAGKADSARSSGGSGTDSAKAAAATLARPERADSGKAGSGLTGAGTAAATGGAVSPLADSVFARLYEPYRRGDDPLELRHYYVDYRRGNYAAVLAVGDSTGLGIGQRKVVIRDYMRLYRGLSYLATGDARDAVPELEAVVLRTKPGDILYETAQWYLALAWVKRTDVDPTDAKNNALGLARNVSHSYSRYREPAREFINELGQ